MHNVLAVEVNLKPDYSWVPDELTGYVGGIVAIVLICSGIVFIYLVLSWLFSKSTATLVDNPKGLKSLVSAFMVALLVGSLAAGVQWGNNVFGQTGLSQSLATSGTGAGKLKSASEQTADAAAESKKAATENFAQAGDDFKDSWDKATKGDVGGALKSVGSGIWEGLKGVGNSVKSGAQSAWSGIQYAAEDPAGAWEATKDWIVQGSAKNAAAVWDKVHGEWGWF